MNLHLSLTGLICLIGFAINAQNLVPNNGFEEYSALPNAQGQWNRCNGWTNAGGTPVNGFFGDPDYLHLNGGFPAQLPSTPPAFVNPHSGDAIMAFLGYREPAVGATDIREYLSVELSEPLEIGTAYSISFWISNGESSIGHFYQCDGIGVLLSGQEPQQIGTSYIDREPQVKIEGEFFSNEWVRQTFTYEADSAYTHLTIGNFYSDEETSVSVAVEGPLPFPGAYYFVDEVSVIPDVPASPGDLDGNGVIDINDLLEILADLGCLGLDCEGDLNGDGIVNMLDVLMFLGLY